MLFILVTSTPPQKVAFRQVALKEKQWAEDTRPVEQMQ